MQKETQLRLTVWIKRIVGFTAIGLWVVVIYTIAQSPAPFIEQAPYCMVSTMLIFGLLSAVHKGLDYWSLDQKND